MVPRALIALSLGSLWLTTACSGSDDSSTAATSETAGGASGSGGAGGSSAAGTGGSAQGGSAGTGGASGQSGSSGQGGAMPSCPEKVPAAGSACAPDGLTCSYTSTADVCCPDQQAALCSSGTWSIAHAGDCFPPSTTCPASAPAPGDACDPCKQQGTCLPAACQDGEQVSALACVQTGSAHTGTWQPQTATCDTSFACGSGGLRCKGGEVCFVGDSPAFCKADPCAGQALDCSCAKSECPPKHVLCGVSEPRTVSCYISN